MSSVAEDLIEALRESKERFGALYPVIRTKDGEVVDGKHRLEADPDWPVREVELKHPWDALILRLVANMVRREVSPEEKTETLNELARVTKWSPKEIAENLGVSDRWVRKYLGAEHKKRTRPKGSGEIARRAISVGEEARRLGFEVPEPSRGPTAECPLCGSRVPVEFLQLKLEDVMYSDPELTVLELLERAKRGDA